MKSLPLFLKRILRSGAAFSSREYWIGQYAEGGNSGPGSYGHLAKFKADVLNEFVSTHPVSSVLELGCGDGSQLSLASYPQYTGYDISEAAITACRNRFVADPTKEFFMMEDYDGRKADLALSLDVIFHLTEDDSFECYMRRLFDVSPGYVVICSSNTGDAVEPRSDHVRHRRFASWTEGEFVRGWRLAGTNPNANPCNGDHRSTLFCDFLIYE